MSMSPSIPGLRSAPILTGERLRAGLEACGYRCTTALLSGGRSLPPGCTVSLQFGDCIANAADGVTCLTVRCSIQINGSEENVSGLSRWQVRKHVRAPGGVERLCFAIEAELILGRNIGLADILAHGGDIYRHLHLLIGDASATLHDLEIDDMRGDEAGALVLAPVMRIEARFFRDLAAGRSGLLAADQSERTAHPTEVAARHLQITRAACDWLKDDILPDLASAVRRMALQVQTSILHRSPSNGATEQGLGDPCQSASRRHGPSTQTAISQGERDAAATLVPEQIQ